jgi:hypothetical protein
MIAHGVSRGSRVPKKDQPQQGDRRGMLQCFETSRQDARMRRGTELFHAEAPRTPRGTLFHPRCVRLVVKMSFGHEGVREKGRPQPRCGWVGGGIWSQGRPRSSATGWRPSTPLLPHQTVGRALKK